MDTGGGERLHLVGRSALASGDDRAGVAHAPPRRRGLSGDESDDRLLDMCLDIGGSSFLRCASDFANQDDGLRLGVLIEQFEGVDVVGADNGIAADADRSRLADPSLA